MRRMPRQLSGRSYRLGSRDCEVCEDLRVKIKALHSRGCFIKLDFVHFFEKKIWGISSIFARFFQF